MKSSSIYFLYITDYWNDKAPTASVVTLHWELRPNRNHSYCWVTRSAAAGVGNSETVAILPCFWHTLLQENSWRPSLETVVSRQLNAVNTFLMFNVRFEIFKYEIHLKSSRSYRGSFLIWSEVNRDCSCQDLLLAKRTWLFFPCSIAAKNSMGNFAAVQPAVIFKQGHCCVLTLILYFHLVSMLIHPMFSFWYLVLYAYTV